MKSLLKLCISCHDREFLPLVTLFVSSIPEDTALILPILPDFGKDVIAKSDIVTKGTRKMNVRSVWQVKVSIGRSGEMTNDTRERFLIPQCLRFHIRLKYSNNVCIFLIFLCLGLNPTHHSRPIRDILACVSLVYVIIMSIIIAVF